MTATIIKLGRPPVNKPGPLDDEHKRMFMYKFSGELEDLERAATYSLRDASWSVVRALASPAEVRNAVEAFQERGWINPAQLDWDLFLLPHYQWYDTQVWLVVGRRGEVQLGFTRTHLHAIGVEECGRLTRIYAGSQPCWIQGVGFVGPLELEGALR
jgi:hypothetical protein